MVEATRARAADAAKSELPPAPQAELDALIAHFEELLEPEGYFRPPVARRRRLAAPCAALLTKPGWNHLEVRTLARAFCRRSLKKRARVTTIPALPDRGASDCNL